MGYGNAIGGLAGGFAQGYNMAQDSKRRNADERRRQEEHDYLRQERERERQIREGTGQYIATEGQEVTTDYTMAPGARGNLDSGDVYTPTRQKQTQEGAWQGAARHAARLGADPQRVAQIETTGLQLAGKRRDEKYAKREESVTDFLAKHQGSDDPTFYRAAAQFATNYGDDGKSFGVEPDPQGGFRLVMTADGQARSKTVTNRKDLERLLMSYASPKMRKEAEELGLKDRQVGAAETSAAAAARTATATEGYRKDQAPVLTAQASMYTAHANAYNAQAEYYRKGGGRGQYERLPEGDKILLQSRESQEKALITQLGTADPSQHGAINARLMDIKREQYDHLSKLKLLPAGVTKTQYLGLPDPLSVARQAMAGARTEQEFLASMEQFDALYGDAPEAGQARNAMSVFMQQQFYNRVKPQNAPGSGLSRVYREGGAAMDAQGMRTPGFMVGHGLGR